MTSSLVGSEMCIRDSLRSVHVLGVLCFLCSVTAGGPSCARVQVLQAVSYTHLTLPTICSV
eukprot:6807925-Prorocentrum_lima.AAC.1